MADTASPKPAPVTEEPRAKSTTAYEFEPPLAAVRKVVKAALPEGVKMGSETTQAFAKAAGIFIHYLTSCANDFCKENKRSTINADDVLDALKELEFEDMVGPLQEFLKHFRVESAEKKAAAASKKAEAERVAAEAAASEGKEDTPEATAMEIEGPVTSPAIAEAAPAEGSAPTAEAPAPAADEQPLVAVALEEPVPEATVAGAAAPTLMEAAADAAEVGSTTVEVDSVAPPSMEAVASAEAPPPETAADDSMPEESAPDGTEQESATLDTQTLETGLTATESETQLASQDSAGPEDSMDVEASATPANGV